MSKKIKIAFFINNLGQGGAEKQFFTLIKNIDKEKFDVHVFLYAYQRKAFYDEIFKIPDIVIIKNYLRHTKAVFKILEAGCYIRRQLLKQHYDLVISTLFLNNFLVRLFAPHNYKNKIIANVRTSLNAYTKWHKLTEKRQVKNSYLVFNSNIALDHFKNIIPPKYHRRLYLIYNGFSIPPSTKSNSNLIFGCLGRLNIEKNFIQAVRVFQSFEKDHPSAKLIIQGYQGNQYDAIVARLASANIELRKEDPNITTFYETVRVLIIPSLFEGCPNVLFEALLRRRICIISNGANTDNFIVDGINGFVYDGSDQGLLSALERVFKILDTEIEARIIETGYNYAVANFSVDTMVNKYEQLFLSIHESHKD